MARYKRNFITEAIIRIDFGEVIDEFREEVPERVRNEIEKFFSQTEMRRAFNEEILLDAATQKVNRRRTEFKEWNFFGNERKRRLVLTEKFMFASFNKYISHDGFIEPFEQILGEMSKRMRLPIFSRVGMRYINNIKLDNGNPLEWDGYISDKMLSILRIAEEPFYTKRAFHILELGVEQDDSHLKLQFGMHNPDFPAKIKQKVFVLDIDAYKSGEIVCDETNDLLSTFHDRIEKFFEDAICQNLRDVMNE